MRSMSSSAASVRKPPANGLRAWGELVHQVRQPALRIGQEIPGHQVVLRILVRDALQAVLAYLVDPGILVGHQDR